MDRIIVFDLGLHENQTLAKKIRALGYFSEIKPVEKVDVVRDERVKACIISGSEEDRAGLDERFIQEIKAAGLDFIELYKRADDSLIFCQDGREEIIAREDFEGSYLKDFTDGLTKMEKNWNMKDYAQSLIEDIQDIVGDKKVLVALSGGVDSSVAATLVSRAVGENLQCIFVDHGLLRENEADEVMEAYSGLNLNVKKIDASGRFLGKLAGVEDPEEKRKIIGEEFIRVFEEESQKLGQIDYLVQGTIYPDIIESGIGAELIKSHHNVGGLPEDVDFKEIIEPLAMLFKDEVRELGLVLGMSEDMVYRQPFPGPGLGIRVIGDITEDKLRIVRETDFILREEVKKAGLDRDIWQYFIVYTPLKAVGIKNGKRAYDNVIAIRAVETTDAMEVKASKLDYELLNKMSNRMIEEVDGVGRVVYDISDKPPSSIEWE